MNSPKLFRDRAQACRLPDEHQFTAEFPTINSKLINLFYDELGQIPVWCRRYDSIFKELTRCSLVTCLPDEFVVLVHDKRTIYGYALKDFDKDPAFFLSFPDGIKTNISHCPGIVIRG